jgi:cell division septal protein FtsQ
MKAPLALAAMEWAAALAAPFLQVAAGTAGGSGAGLGSGRVLDFRRRGAPPRRRRRSLALSLARPLAVAVLTVALPLGLAAWVLTSQRFQLRGVTVSHRHEAASPPAADRVPEAWVRQALAPLTGRNLLRLPLAEVRQRLGGNPWIAAADVAKELPDRLRVTLAERRPVVLLRHGEELFYADSAGRPIAPVASPAEREAARRQGLLVVRFSAPVAGGIAGALQLAERLRLARPAWTSGLTEIEVVDEDDYRLRVDGLPCPLLVRGSRLTDNLARFEQLLPELQRRYPALSAVDLRFARRIVVQPAPAAAPRPSPAAPHSAQSSAGA